MLAQLPIGFFQRQSRLLEFGDITVDATIAGEPAGRVVQRFAAARQPEHLAVRAAPGGHEIVERSPVVQVVQMLPPALRIRAVAQFPAGFPDIPGGRLSRRLLDVVGDETDAKVGAGFPEPIRCGFQEIEKPLLRKG